VHVARLYPPRSRLDLETTGNDDELRENVDDDNADGLDGKRRCQGSCGVPKKEIGRQKAPELSWLMATQGNLVHRNLELCKQLQDRTILNSESGIGACRRYDLK